MGELGKGIEDLQRKKLSDRKVKEYIEVLLPREDGMTPQQQKNVIRLQDNMKRCYYDAPDLQQVDSNAYRFINAVSDFATSKTTPVTSNFKENLFARTMDGNPMIDKAYSLVQAA